MWHHYILQIFSPLQFSRWPQLADSKLALDQGTVLAAVAEHEIVVGPVLGDRAVIDHDDPIGVADLNPRESGTTSD